MRRFHSYGPVDCELHFCVPRRDLVEQCLDYLHVRYGDTRDLRWVLFKDVQVVASPCS